MRTTGLALLSALPLGPLLVYGLAVGISLGLTGGGGSIITVPLLVYAVGEPVHQAIETSLVIVGGIALMGFFGRIREADPSGGIALGLTGVLGAIPGRIAAHFFAGSTLLLLFAIIMVIASIAMFRPKSYEISQITKRNWVLITLAGIALGFLTGFLGVGGGFLIVPVLVLLLGMPMRSAIPTSLLVIGINCFASLLATALLSRGVRVSAGIDWYIAVIFVVGGLVGNLVGAAVAQRLNARTLKRVFAVFIFFLGLFVAGGAAGLIPLPVK
ncbi:MAG: sulfite exporter TauE/SafE family protein [Candidatus Eremiobacteraeota bacterium]|nr:sulfite exporter TauE/SafE family protein [Candidatus Eremiobacteraeota bacterium]